MEIHKSKTKNHTYKKKEIFQGQKTPSTNCNSSILYWIFIIVSLEIFYILCTEKTSLEKSIFTLDELYAL